MHSPPGKVVFVNQLEPSQHGLVGWGVAVELSLAALAVGLGALVGFSPLGNIDLSRDALSDHLAAVFWGMVATVPMLSMLMLVENLPVRCVRRLRHFVHRHIVPVFARESIGGLAVISAAAGVGEELLFRGLVQAGLAAWINGRHGTWIAVATASLAFGLAHCLTRSYVVLASIIGAYLGWLFWFSGHLLVPIVAHGLYDFVALVYLVKWTARRRG